MTGSLAFIYVPFWSANLYFKEERLMPSKIWINPKCPMCGGDVYFPKKEDHP